MNNSKVTGGDRLVIGEVYESYREACKWLGGVITTGRAKQLQLQIKRCGGVWEGGGISGQKVGEVER